MPELSKLQQAVVHALRIVDDSDCRGFAQDQTIAAVQPVIDMAEIVNREAYWHGMVQGLVANAMAVCFNLGGNGYLIPTLDDHSLSEYTIRVKDFMERLCETIVDDLEKRNPDA